LSLDTGPLRKILQLEYNKGYTDAAVIGGLDRFLNNWASRAITAITNPRLLDRLSQLGLVNSSYGSLAPQERQQWVRQVIDFLDEVDGVPGAADGRSQSAGAELAVTPASKQPTVGHHSLDSPVTVVRGISTALAGKFDKLGVTTVDDLLYFFPHRHLDYSQRKTVSQLREGDEQTVIAHVWQAQRIRPGGRQATEAIVGDETGNVRVVWFNQPYIAQKLRTNTRIIISGRVSLFRGRHVFQSPEWELLEEKELIHTGRLVPVYSLTQGLRPRQVRKLMKQVVDQWAWQVADTLPSAVRQRCNLLELADAISQAHYPDDEVMKAKARIRLAFDELFLLQLGVLHRRRHWQQGPPSNPLTVDRVVLDRFLGSLSFTLTAAQQRVLKELLSDLGQRQPMSRLLQGEVGSGKTVVATAALLMAAANGYQGAFMAPTEILAEQHFASIGDILSRVGEIQGGGYIYHYSGILSRPLTLALLIGDIQPAQKQELQQRIIDGEVDIIIGTHALIQTGVDFPRLGLVVVDEQHRFGVTQRSALRQKGTSPHVLVMTATPIPRTLALTLYGDLDLSVIDELPPGRQVVKTRWLKSVQRNSAYDFVRREVDRGRQAFIICPLVEESAVIEARAAVAEYERLSGEVFSDLKLGLLHGRMSAEEKERVMRRFRQGKLDILVSTPVVEVGIDVPNATVMLVESADRFGLSQLHQFRGRVGRGPEPSYCLLLAQNPSVLGRERLDLIERIRDGFMLAEEDLRLRGPGEFFGTRQSGLPDLRMAKLSDVALLELARSEATQLFQQDPNLTLPQHQLISRELARVWHQEAELS